jgi:hypothetical protein
MRREKAINAAEINAGVPWLNPAMIPTLRELIVRWRKGFLPGSEREISLKAGLKVV